MRALTILLFLLFTMNGAFAQHVEVNIDERAIERQIELGMQRLENVLAKVNLNLDVNLAVLKADQVNLDGPQKLKIFSRTYPATANDKVVLSNEYGSMQIKTWEKKEVKVEVSIKAYGNSDTDAQKLLDGVNIEAGKQGDQVVFKTKINQVNLGLTRKRGRVEVKVDYIVYMPVSNSLTLSQNYGNVSLEDLTGALYAKVQYGNFSATNLKSNNNYISVQYGKTDIQRINKAVIKHQYGSGLTIGTVSNLDLDAQYAAVSINTIRGMALIKQQYGSGLTIGTTEQLDLNIQYANATINTVKANARINQQYSNLSLGTVSGLDLNTQYTSVTIGSLKGNGNIDMQYNKLSIDEVGAQCRSLQIDGNYLAINVGFAGGFNADFDVKTSYAPFKYGDQISAQLLGDRNSTSKNYTGRIGNGGTGLVKIKSDYGSVLFR
ncbi:hypothetical protein [Pedobacter sp. GR22-6]|uniref:hypothetical protein n=1 Tax=Pedobacter sp. GR22-6 TaxID=3127957 RepID=UPI00307EF17C